MPSWGMFLSTLQGGLQLGLSRPLLWHSLKRHPRNFSTKCLLFYSCHHLYRKFAVSENCGGSILMHYYF